jgi:hypothetical protein
MTERLAHTNSELSRKVLAFDGPQMIALSAFVLQAQALVGMSDHTRTGLEPGSVVAEIAGNA